MKRLALKNWLIWCFTAVVLTGCHWDLWNQDRYEPLEQGDFWGEGESSSRGLVEGTVPYLGARLNTAYYKGMDSNDEFITALPARLDLDGEEFEIFLRRGQERFNIYCIVCHGEQGLGDGMIPKRGFPNPPSYMDQRLLDVPIGYFYDVMTNGFGRMYSYKSRVSVEDRWAIASYIRVLQLSQYATPDLLTEDLLEKARNSAVAAVDAGGHDDAAAGGHEAESNEDEEEVQGEH